MSKLFSTILITALIVGLFAGCGGKLEESYMMVSLKDASVASIKSPGFKFGFDTPKFIAAVGNLALVREGNLIEFFTGQDLENKIKLVEGKKYVVGTRKIFSPRVHFTVDFFVVSGDTIKVDQAYGVKFPAIIRGFDESDFEEINLADLTSSTRSLKDIYDTKFKVSQATITYEEVNYKGEPEMAYLVNLPKVRFILEDMTSDIELMVKALINEHLYFNGGLSYGDAPSASLFPRSYRDRTNIGGKATLEYLKYAGEVISVTR